MIRASIDFLGFGYLELMNFTKIIIVKSNGNSLVPNLPADIAALIAADLSLSNAYTAWEVEKGKTEHDTLNTAHDNLCGLLTQDADYVTLVSQGDATKINSTGFHATLGKSSSTGENYYVKVGDNSGEVILFYAKEDNEVAVVWLVAKLKTVPTDDDYRYLVSTNLNLYVKDGFERGSCCWFKAVGVKTGKNETNEDFMPAIMKFIP